MSAFHVLLSKELFVGSFKFFFLAGESIRNLEKNSVKKYSLHHKNVLPSYKNFRLHKSFLRHKAVIILTFYRNLVLNSYVYLRKKNRITLIPKKKKWRNNEVGWTIVRVVGIIEIVRFKKSKSKSGWFLKALTMPTICACVFINGSLSWRFECVEAYVCLKRLGFLYLCSTGLTLESFPPERARIEAQEVH